MCEFVKKSLAVSKWNEFLNCYVYGIHDLLLHYLRLQLSDEEKKVCTSSLSKYILKLQGFMTCMICSRL